MAINYINEVYGIYGESNVQVYYDDRDKEVNLDVVNGNGEEVGIFFTAERAKALIKLIQKAIDKLEEE